MGNGLELAPVRPTTRSKFPQNGIDTCTWATNRRRRLQIAGHVAFTITFQGRDVGLHIVTGVEDNKLEVRS